jgi:hypothetical protein
MSNNKCFDDFFGTDLNKSFHTPLIQSITIYHNDQYVLGIECTHKSLNQTFNPIKNLSNCAYNAQSVTLNLEFGEHIEEISGRAGDSIDFLRIKTSKNKEICAGGNGGQSFNNLLGWGIHDIVAFGGSFSDLLDSLYVIHK